MTAATTLRPTPAGTVKFAAFYAALIALPFAATLLLVDRSATAFIGPAVGFLVAGLAFAGLVRAGWFTLNLTDRGIETRALRRTSLLPWEEIDHFEIGRFLGREMWVRARGRPDDTGRGADLAAVGAVLFGMTAPELRDYLTIELNRRTGSPT